MLKQLISFEWMVGSFISFFLNSSEFHQGYNGPTVSAVTRPACASIIKNVMWGSKKIEKIEREKIEREKKS